MPSLFLIKLKAGAIFISGQFGSVMWSRSECHLLYVAEKKKPKTSSFFDSNSASEGDVVKTEETKKVKHVYPQLL